jgi:DNA-directed RNA polymerase specialized sigma subunit
MTKNEILEYIYNNKMLSDAIRNIVTDKNHYEDFRSHFLQQVCEIKEHKLIEYYEKRYLDYYCLNIITNQWKSKTSTYYKIHKNNGFSGERIIDFVDYEIGSDLKDEEVIEIDSVEIKKRMMELLKEQYEDFMINQYHQTLFHLYYFDDLNLKQIEKLNGINFNAVSRSVRKTKAYLKTKIKI